MNTETTATQEDEPFAKVEAAECIDVLLQTMQESQVQFSAMADEKANIMITVCSILLTLAVAELEKDDLLIPISIFCLFITPALIFSIMTVIPSTPNSNLTAEDILEKRAAFNPFFFMHFSLIPIGAFEAEFEKAITKPSTLYRTVARDLYFQGLVLRKKKYRYLRWSYISLLMGIGFGAVALIISVLAN